MPEKADAHYLEARDAILSVVEGLDRGASAFRTADGTTFTIQRKTPLRLYLLIIYRRASDERAASSFSFQRNGRVNLGGQRKVPLRQSMVAGHEPWVSRTELLELASELRKAEPYQG
jgi:hypothetical protein